MSDLVLRVGAKAFIRHKDKFLLLREGAPDGTQIGKYQIPGGMVELGEPFMDALMREVKEETGLKVRPILPIMIDGWMPAIESVPHQIIGIFYLCEAESDNVVLSHEHDDFVWIKPYEIKNYDVPHPVPQIFGKYEEIKDKKWSEI
jgi:8-oxo-dGTP diphosphatase